MERNCITSHFAVFLIGLVCGFVLGLPISAKAHHETIKELANKVPANVDSCYMDRDGKDTKEALPMVCIIYVTHDEMVKPWEEVTEVWIVVDPKGDLKNIAYVIHYDARTKVKTFIWRGKWPTDKGT